MNAMLKDTQMFRLSAAMLAVVAGGAMAEPMGTGFDPAGPQHSPIVPGYHSDLGGGGSGGGGYGDRSNPTSGVNPNDRASMAILMYDADLNFTTVNTTGEVNITRGSTPTPSGFNRNGQGLILFAWDEVVSGSRTIIRATMRTSNGEALVPATAQVVRPGAITAPAVYWSWRFGMIDPVNFRADITSTQLRRASISFSSDGGASYFQTTTHTNTITHRNDWRPGFDDGELLTTVGDGTNFVLLQYEVSYVPSPGAAAILGAGVLTIARRRRR
jgi:hypothetical protein